MHRWWTDTTELEAHFETAREARFTPGPLLDEALANWQNRKKQNFSLCRDSSSPWEAVWDETRRFVLDRVELHDEASDLNAECLGRHEHDGYFEDQIVFTGTPPLRVPATVLIPQEGSGPYPAMVILHDMGSFQTFGREKMLAFPGEPAVLTKHRQTYYGGNSIMADLARMGYVVIAIDSLNFGERTIAAARDLEAFKKKRLSLSEEEEGQWSRQIQAENEGLVRNIMFTGRTLAGLIIDDDRRTVDYLCSRSDVDAKRIGCVGLSYGAYRANYLGGLDERIKAAISVCWTSSSAGVLGYNVLGAIGWFILISGLFEQVDMPDLQALTAPRAFMAISGWQDILMQPFGIAQAHLYLRDCYERAGCPEKLGSLVYDAPHEFNPTMQKDAFSWLEEHLT